MTAPVTPQHLYRAIAAAVSDDADVTPPQIVNLVEPVAGAAPLVCLDLLTHDDARAWAEYVGLADRGALHSDRTGQVVSFTGKWLGWTVLLTAREPTMAMVAAAALTPDAGTVS